MYHNSVKGFRVWQKGVHAEPSCNPPHPHPPQRETIWSDLNAMLSSFEPGELLIRDGFNNVPEMLYNECLGCEGVRHNHTDESHLQVRLWN